MQNSFKVNSEYLPTGDQPRAIESLAAGLEAGMKAQTLLGVTGSGKTYSMAKTIEEVGRPALVIAHNKTLAAQLANEFAEFFPNNAVEYFVSYYDYYQPEAYVPRTDTFIEKDAQINEDIDRLRHSTTSSLFTRRDVIVVASVSAIYGLGSPEEYRNKMVLLELDVMTVYPASHFVTGEDRLATAIKNIEAEAEERVAELEGEGKVLEAYRLKQRTQYDLEMMRELGYTSGIENYSRHLDGRPPGSTPYTLLDYFPDDYITFIDESHITLPQVRGMYNGVRSRKTTLVEFGFRLPSALDNRPLMWDEFLLKTNQMVFVSATPGPYELENSGQIVEQIIRPTGLVDPEVEVRPTKNQIDDLLNEVAKRVEHGERVLITTLTIKMAEDLTDYLLEHNVKARYMHANIETLDRIQIIRGLRTGEFDVLVGINLLREGLDLPEVTLVAILDADKEGFLRGERALIQTIGRAARNVNGRVIMYADKETDAMRVAIGETERRREIQSSYNEQHGIEPRTITKGVSDILIAAEAKGLYKAGKKTNREAPRDPDELRTLIADLEAEMREAAVRADTGVAKQIEAVGDEPDGAEQYDEAEPEGAQRGDAYDEGEDGVY